MLLHMHLALRCHAKSKRSGLRCQAPGGAGLASAGCTGRQRGSQGEQERPEAWGDARPEKISALARMARETIGGGRVARAFERTLRNGMGGTSRLSPSLACRQVDTRQYP
jgi:hypothetical protein